MKCFYCDNEASAKVGSAKGNIWRALFGGKAWDKTEVYVCRDCFTVYESVSLAVHSKKHRVWFKRVIAEKKHSFMWRANLLEMFKRAGGTLDSLKVE